MKRSKKNIRVGILGCGAIGSGIAKSISKELKGACRLTGLLDRDADKTTALAKTLKDPKLGKRSLKELLAGCDLMVEAVNAADTKPLIRQALLAKKDVLCMSVGKLLNAQNLLKLALKNHCTILIPSGAIAGIDAIKAACLKGVSRISLTTRKPPAGLQGIPYLEQQGIDLTKLSSETVIFEGDVNTAVKFFPQNINVAATLALASQQKSNLTIRIITSPTYTVNSHEIELIGSMGRIFTRSESIACPDNPKTSYLAGLSGIQTLKEYCSGVRVGT